MNVRTPIVNEAPPKRLTSKALSSALSGTYQERLEEEKTIILIYKPGQRPEVTFTGFWNGRFIRAAQDSIARAYRLRRRHQTRKQPIEADTKNPKVGEGGKGDA